MVNLNEHIRQYCHNTGEGLLIGYDKDGIDGAFDAYESRIKELEARIARLEDTMQEVACANTKTEACIIADCILMESPLQSIFAIKADGIYDAILSVEGQVSGRCITGLFREYANELSSKNPTA